MASSADRERAHRVLVFCRQCPEQTAAEPACLSALDAEARALTLRRDSHPPRTYVFDGVFAPCAPQSQIFADVARPLVDDVLQGLNATCLAYGQTGTGKTHTMLGPLLAGLVDSGGSGSDDGGGGNGGRWSAAAASESAGIIPRCVARIFSELAAARAKGGGAEGVGTGVDASTGAGAGTGAGASAVDPLVRNEVTAVDAVDCGGVADEEEEEEHSVAAAYVQIYCEAVLDLLAPQSLFAGGGGGGDPSSAPAAALSAASLSLREDPEQGVYVEGATWVAVADAEQCLAVLARGSKGRAVAATLMNAHSSRSHSILMLRVERRLRQRLPRTHAPGQAAPRERERPAPRRVQRGTLFLVDLAGSERQARSGASGAQLDEMRAINLSLSALGNCIAALASRGDAARRGAATAGASTGAGAAAGAVVHVPFRDSKLTRLLQDSLGGNARTSLVVTVSSAAHSASETQSTLEFGARAARVAVHAVRNEALDYRALYLALRGAHGGGAAAAQLAAPLPAPSPGLEQALAEVARLRGELEELRAALAQAQTQAQLPALARAQALAARLRVDLSSSRAALDASQQQLLAAVSEQRCLRERLREAERTLTTRVAQLLEDKAEAAAVAEEAEARADAAEAAAEELRVQQRGRARSSAAELSAVGDGGALSVDEVSRLYEASIRGLQARVSKIELKCDAQGRLVQELAYRLRVRERQLQQRRQEALLARRRRRQARRLAPPLGGEGGEAADDDDDDDECDVATAEDDEDELAAAAAAAATTAAPAGGGLAVATALRSQQQLLGPGPGPRRPASEGSAGGGLLGQHLQAIALANTRLSTPLQSQPPLQRRPPVAVAVSSAMLAATNAAAYGLRLPARRS